MCVFRDIYIYIYIYVCIHACILFICTFYVLCGCFVIDLCDLSMYVFCVVLFVIIC